MVSGVSTKKKSTLVVPKVPKLYEHEMWAAQKAAGALGAAVNHLVGPWQGPGGGSVFFLAFSCPKDIKTAKRNIQKILVIA